MEEAFGAIGVDFSICDRRCGAGSFIETEVITVGGGIIEGPDRLASFGIQSLDSFLVFQPVKQDELATSHRGAAESLADFSLPKQARPFRGPFAGKIAGGINSVARRAEQLRPVTGRGVEGEEQRNTGKEPSCCW